METNESEIRRIEDRFNSEMVAAITTRICEIKRGKHGHVIGYNQKGIEDVF
jgi:hypothetical protein